jgi:hypothetical protein
MPNSELSDKSLQAFKNLTANTTNLNNPETQQMNLDTRLAQLDAAIHMEL